MGRYETQSSVLTELTPVPVPVDLYRRDANCKARVHPGGRGEDHGWPVRAHGKTTDTNTWACSKEVLNEKFGGAGMMVGDAAMCVAGGVEMLCVAPTAVLPAGAPRAERLGH